MNLNLSVLSILLSANFMAFASDYSEAESSKKFTGISPSVYENSVFIRPGSPAAQDLEKDLDKRKQLSAAAIVHGFVVSDKK